MNKPSFTQLRGQLVHPARTAIASVLAVLAARAVGLPEVVWAPISTIIVMQSTLGAALTVSGKRLAGTALGSAAGALLVAGFGTGLVAFGLGVFVMGLLCMALRLDRAAYRFAGITLTVIMIVASTEPVGMVAVHRFVEVSIGIGVGVVVMALLPEKENDPAKPAVTDVSQAKD